MASVLTQGDPKAKLENDGGGRGRQKKKDKKKR